MTGGLRDDHPFTARVWRLARNYDAAIASYRALTERRPWDGVLHYYLGDVLAGAGRHADAAESFGRAVARGQWLVPSGLAQAAAFARSGQTDRAIEALETAVANGLRDARRIEREAAFESLRDDPRMRALIAKLDGR